MHLPSYSLFSQARSLLGPLPSSIRPDDYFSLICQAYNYVSRLRHSTFVECITARQRLRETLLSIQERNEYLIPASIRAALEVDSLELVLSLLATKPSDPRYQGITNTCASYCQTLLSLSANNLVPTTSDSSPRCALVLGPSSIEKDFFDSAYQAADVIATPDLTVPTAYGGSSKSIYLYINNYKARARTSEITSVLSQCDRVFFKEHSSMSYLGHATNNKLALMNCPGSLLLTHYGPTMIPTILYDLLLRGFSSLSLVGTTFYAYGLSYRQSYKSNDLSRQSILASIKRHDPFPGFNLCARLYKHRILRADTDCAELLSSGELHYAAMLDTAFF